MRNERRNRTGKYDDDDNDGDGSGGGEGGGYIKKAEQ